MTIPKCLDLLLTQFDTTINELWNDDHDVKELVDIRYSLTSAILKM